jgi:hypothetical protein
MAKKSKRPKTSGGAKSKPKQAEGKEPDIAPMRPVLP